MDRIEMVNLDGWQPTRETLHAYVRILSAVPRMWLPPHPNWWQISLLIRPDGLVTQEMPVPSGSSVCLEMDLRRHAIRLKENGTSRQSWDIRSGMTTHALADELRPVLAGFGIEGAYASSQIANDDPREYDPAAAERFRRALLAIGQVLSLHRASLPGDPGPVQFWPHGFDAAFEWFGTRMVVFEEGGSEHASPAQVNFGWAPGDPSHADPYFYSNPWPFDEHLVDHSLPEGSRWFREGWNGTIFPYRALVDDPHAAERLLAYWGRVYEIAHPTLMA